MATKSFDLSFIIPAKNEEGNIEKLYLLLKQELKKLRKSYEIIFIDDGSTDTTFDIFKKIQKKDKYVKIIKHRGNFGKSIALQTGFDLSKGKIIFTMDADLQDNPKEVRKFLKKLNEGYDMVSGWKKKRKDPISKTIPSKVVNYLVRLMTGLKLHDINCGFKAYRRETIKNLYLYGDLYRFIPIFIYRQNFKVGEIEVEHLPRKFGKSKYGWRRFISGWLDLLTVFFLVRYLKRPGHFFGTFGLITLTIGLLIDVYIAALKIVTGSIQDHYPLLFLGILSVMVGIQLITTGLLAEMFLNFNQQKRSPDNYIDKYLK